MVEGFLRDLTQNRLRRGVFRDVEELIMAIEGYIDRHNENPKPLIWTAKTKDTLENVKRARKALNNAQSVRCATLAAHDLGEKPGRPHRKEGSHR